MHPLAHAQQPQTLLAGRKATPVIGDHQMGVGAA
jgi:hypothetical protein